MAEYLRRHHPNSRDHNSIKSVSSHPEDTMSKSVQLIKDHDVKWIDLRFTDTKGKQQHVTMPARDALEDDFFEVGKCSTVPPSLAGKASKRPT